jgi:hypothetical protein
MRNYQSDKAKSWHWVKRQEYIPASDALGNCEILGWKLIEKFPIDKIKYDPNNYPNKLDLAQVLDMTNEFFPFGFYPIRIDKKGNLKDGLHRLTFAKWSCLKYIDVFVEYK